MTALMRVFSSLLVHIGFVAVAAGLVYFLGSSENAVLEAVRTQYADDPAALEEIRSGAVWKLIDWILLSLTASWALSSLWLLLAERQKPRTYEEGASHRGLWILFLLLSLAATAAIGWVRIWSSHVLGDLAANVVSGGMLILALSVLLAYWAATAVSVKTVMRPSVPLCNLLPSIAKDRA
jgi:hypothetical protein